MSWFIQKYFFGLFIPAVLFFDVGVAQGGSYINGCVVNILPAAELLLPGNFFSVVADQNNGYYLAAGITKSGYGTINRYVGTGNNAGQLDTSFNGTGVVIDTNVGTWYGIATDYVNATDVVVAVGTNYGGTTGVIVRYTGGTGDTAGTLDTTFNTTGFVANINVTSWFGVVVDSDHNIIAVGQTNTGYGIIARYSGAGDNAGSLDTSFNENGIIPGCVISTSADTNANAWYGVTFDSNATPNIIVAGQTNSACGVVARYTSAGILDTNFNTNGFAISSADDTNALMWTSVGYGQDASNNNAPVIAVAGQTQTGYALVACYNGSMQNAGSLYTTFNHGTGFAVSSSNDTDASIWSSVAVYSDVPLSITVAGITAGGSGVVAQYLDTGSLKSGPTGFTQNGFVTSTNADTNASQWNSVIVQSNGEVVVAGLSNSGYGATAWYKSDGALDTGFNNETGFITSTPLCAYVDTWNSIVLDSNNNYVMGGQSNSGYGVIARCTQTRNFDFSFNANGTPGFVVIDNLDGNDSPTTMNAIAVDTNNNIVAVGATHGGNAIVVRYTSEGLLDTSFNASHGYITSTLTPSWNDVVIDSGNNIAVVGATSDGNGIIACYTSSGFNMSNGSVTNGNIGYLSATIDRSGNIVGVGSQINKSGLISLIASCFKSFYP